MDYASILLFGAVVLGATLPYGTKKTDIDEFYPEFREQAEAVIEAQIGQAGTPIALTRGQWRRHRDQVQIVRDELFHDAIDRAIAKSIRDRDSYETELSKRRQSNGESFEGME